MAARPLPIVVGASRLLWDLSGECQAAPTLLGTSDPSLLDFADHLGGRVFKLIRIVPQRSFLPPVISVWPVFCRDPGSLWGLCRDCA